MHLLNIFPQELADKYVITWAGSDARVLTMHKECRATYMNRWCYFK